MQIHICCPRGYDHVVWFVDANILEENICFCIQDGRWWQYGPLKHRYPPTGQHGHTTLRIFRSMNARLWSWRNYSEIGVHEFWLLMYSIFINSKIKTTLIVCGLSSDRRFHVQIYCQKLSENHHWKLPSLSQADIHFNNSTAGTADDTRRIFS